MRKDEIIAIEFFTKESTREQMDVIVLDMWIFMEMKENLYSWRLDHNDPIPKGKKMELSLREKEKQLEQDMFNGLVPRGGGLTVLELVEKYVSLKIGVRQSTYAGYKTVINLLKKDDFGKKESTK